ncbi:MAG: Fic family protein [Caldilineaceae bacterium]|nr:Fic family protein [Caldilineaceae bacterium]MBP8110508.1 Fic family protein [Caldilineaceae bacterium]MBP8125441.1 Fic family protein [Caldilineaceae bacterium]MBP9075090.1 Fic family protein [Caldilineaceae bacterium]
MRTYEETHPWIRFQADLRQIDYRLWLMLGEAQSKCQHIAGVPLLPGVAEALHQIYLAKGVLATTAIEGNTLTEEQVLQRIKGQLDLPPSKQYLGQEIDNIVLACNQIAEEIFQGQGFELDVKTFKAYNRQVLQDLSVHEGVEPGVIRPYSVGVGSYRGAPAEDCEYLLGRLATWLNQDFAPPEGRYPVAFGLIKAVLAHLYLAWIHPFGDGNGRVARLVEFHILLASGVPSAAAQLLSNHYNQTRSEYYRQLERASQSGGDIMPFIRYAVQGFIDGLQEQLELIQGQQLHVHWVNFIHDQFHERNSATDIRRRHLVLDLTTVGEPVPAGNVRRISPRVAESYAGKTEKTIQRDLIELERMDLIQRTPQGIQVRRDRLLAFLPGRRPVVA